MSFPLRRRHPPCGKSEERTSPVYDAPDCDIKSYVPVDTLNIEMISCNEYYTSEEQSDRESLINK